MLMLTLAHVNADTRHVLVAVLKGLKRSKCYLRWLKINKVKRVIVHKYSSFQNFG